MAHSRYHPSEFAPPERYLALLDRHLIAGAVLVQPSFLGTDNSFMCEAIARWPDRLRGVAVVGEELEPEELERLRAQGIRAVRLNLVGQPDPDFTSPRWRLWLNAVRTAGLSVDIHATGARWSRLLPPLLDQGITVVVEHMGRPETIPMQCPGFRAILAAAASGRAWVKLSAPYRMPQGIAERAVPHLLDAFGPGRLLWASDYPWTQHEAGKSMEGARAWLLDLGLTGEQLRAIAGGSARVLYDLPAGED